MRSIDEYFTQHAHSTLYHYTGIGALLKIADSKRLFASHAYYLNDAREITHASSLLQRTLSEYEKCSDAEERSFLQQFVKWLMTMRDTAYGVFVFSLSEKSSLLSQWRSYTPHGKGVSLGFSSDFLNAILAGNGFRLAKCIYDPEEQHALAVALVDKMFVSFRTRRNTLNLSLEHQPTRHYKFLEEFRGNLLQVLAIMKHPSFSEESEWRLISSYYPSLVGPHLKFREGSSMLMPYIEIPFPEALEKPFLDQVVLGPSHDPNLSMAALGSFLSNRGICKHITNAAIPFRKWS